MQGVGVQGVPVAGQRYNIQCASRPHLVLQASANPNEKHKLIVWGPHTGNNQKWELQAAPNGAFSLVNVDSRGTLEIPDTTNGEKGTQLHVNRPNGTINEQWFFKPQKEGSFSIHSAYNSLVLNIAGGNYFQGDKVVLWNFEDGGNDTWRFVPTS